MSPTIYIAEDELDLVNGAMSELWHVDKYRFEQVDLAEASDTHYWMNLHIQTDDLIVLDLNFKEYRDPTTQQKAALVCSGKDILARLEQCKQQGYVLELERVLIATSNVREIDPRNPSWDIAKIEGFDVYGLAKGIDARGKVINYGESLVQRIKDIYADPKQERIHPLNYGWRDKSEIPR